MEKKQAVIVPMIALRGLTIFPNMTISFPVGRQRSLDALTAAEQTGGKIFLVTQKNEAVSKPEKDDLYEIGTLAVIKQILKLPGNLTHVVVEGKERGILKSIKEKPAVDFAKIVTVEQDFYQEVDTYLKAMMRMAMEKYEAYLKLVPNTSAVDLLGSILGATKPGQLADYIATGLEIPYRDKQKIIEILNPVERLEKILELMEEEKGILDVKREIENKTKQKVEKSQREYYLREELKVIQDELGDKDGLGAEAEKFRQRLEEKQPPEHVRVVVEKEITRMLRIPTTSPESNVSRNYIETILTLPWTEETPEKFTIKDATKVLDQDHYGLEKIKERILEHLAVRKNAPEESPTILCLVGPPGVGKTSIVTSIAKALNREYVRMSLGGVKDESEIRGHRKTYIGAMPGRIINGMKQAKVINPLILFDEIDKLGVSHNGDPAAALLEVLDAEQNNTFRDHFVEIPYDLSKVLFMCTANSLDTIPRALLDRMEIISLNSYTAQEKFHIAKEHLIKKQRKCHGLTLKQLKIQDSAIESMIDSYTREAGVRQLERVIGEVCRKTVKSIVGEEKKSLNVSSKNIEELLGIKKYTQEEAFTEPQVGIVRGLAWTAVGGTTLSIEVNTMVGEGKFRFTGNIGKVMGESAEVAMAYIRSQGHRLDLPEDFYKKNDMHIHIPQGATPKDGPSAGITMATAMLSALTNTKIRPDVAMTGEITIRGRVLPIGGLQEKVLAAKKMGISHVILPWQNEKDLLEIDKEIRDGMAFTLAKTMEDVLPIVLSEGESIWK